MHDTLPPILSVWSGFAAPLCCLANKSQARLCSESLKSALEANLNGPGSMIYQTVWKPHTTPLGRQIYRLRASGRRTSDSEHSLVHSGWPTPNAGPQNDTDTKWEARRARIKAEKKNGNGFGMTLGMASTLSGWNTPRATDGSNGGPNQAGGALTPDVALSGWPTPTSRDHKDGKECPNVPLNALLGRVAWLTANPQAARITADGTMLTGCSAGMESCGQLNPAFSGWLMGFPEAWCHAAISCQLPTRLRKAPKRPAA